MFRSCFIRTRHCKVWRFYNHDGTITVVEAFKCKNIGGCFDEVLVVANFFSKLDLPTDGISAVHWPHVASQLVFFFAG